MKLLAFDMDETLTVTKQPADEEMTFLLRQVLNKYKIAIITWWMFEDIKRQILFGLDEKDNLENLILMPALWTTMYIWQEDDWTEVYREFLTKQEIEKIKDTLLLATKRSWIYIEKVWGERFINKGWQLCYVVIWKEVPSEIKPIWDPDGKKRLQIIKVAKNMMPDFDFLIGWRTSIDVVRKWIDKSYAIKKLMQFFDLQKEDILFFGDSVFPGWNDWAVKQFWIETIKVNSPEDTKKWIKNFLVL